MPRATQPGGPLYGLQASNPVNTDVAYRGDPKDNCQSDDPMVGGRIGVSGDTSRPDNIVYDITTPPGFAIGVSASGWGHPVCSAAAKMIAASLPVVP